MQPIMISNPSARERASETPALGQSPVWSAILTASSGRAVPPATRDMHALVAQTAQGLRMSANARPGRRKRAARPDVTPTPRHSARFFSRFSMSIPGLLASTMSSDWEPRFAYARDPQPVARRHELILAAAGRGFAVAAAIGLGDHNEMYRRWFRPWGGSSKQIQTPPRR